MPASQSPAVSGRPRTPAHKKAEANQRLVHLVIARRFPFLLRDPERHADAFTAGYMELVGAAERFDPARDRAFSTYAVRCIEGGVLRALRHERRQTLLPTVSLDTPLGDGDGGELADVIADPQAERPGFALIARAGFESLVSPLKPRQQRVIRERYDEGRSPTEIAEGLGVSRARCQQIEQQALKALAAGWTGSERSGKPH